MRYYIISGFPGIGKTYAYKWLTDYIKNKSLNWKVYDTDSSDYSHITDENGLRVIHPDFPNNYISAIKDKLRQSKEEGLDKCIILTSTHEVVRQRLYEEGFEVTVLYPPVGAKEIYMQRYRDRCSPQPLIDKIGENYEQWVNDIQGDESYDSFHVYQLEKDQYLSSIILYLLNEEGGEM